MKKILIAIPLLLASAAGSLYAYVNHRARIEVDQRMQQLVASGAYEKLDYEDMTVQLNGDIKLTNVHAAVANGEFILQDVLVSNLDYEHEIPWHMDVAINGMQLPSGLPDMAYNGSMALEQFMQSLVIDDALPLQVDYSFRYAPENDFQIDSDMNMALPGAFTLNVSSVTRNYALDSMAAIPRLDPDPLIAQGQMQQIMQDMADLEVPAASMTLSDHGVVNALLAIAGEQNSVPAEDLRMLLITQARNAYLFAPQNIQSMAMDTGNQLASFMEGGKTLSINVEPQFGGNIQQLQQEIMGAVFTGNFAQVVTLLNLEIITQ